MGKLVRDKIPEIIKEDGKTPIARILDAVENVFNVIDRRYRSGKPLIITTNLHLSMLTNEQSLDKKRIYDRILELCIPVCVNGASKRTATAKEKMKEMQEIAKSYQKGGDAIE